MYGTDFGLLRQVEREGRNGPAKAGPSSILQLDFADFAITVAGIAGSMSTDSESEFTSGCLQNGRIVEGIDTTRWCSKSTFQSSTVTIFISRLLPDDPIEHTSSKHLKLILLRNLIDL